MKEGPPITLPGNTVLYYLGGEVPLEGRPDTLLRAYAMSSGELVIEDVLRKLPLEGKLYGFAFDPDRQRIAVTICLSGDCFKHSLISTRATEDVVLLSDDGGGTWANLGPPPAEGAYLVGFLGEAILFGLPGTTDSSGFPWRGVLVPSGIPIVGPGETYPVPFDGRSIVWTSARVGVFDQTGGVLRSASPITGLQSDRTGGQFSYLPDILLAYVPGGAAAHAIVEVDVSESPKRAVSWGDFDLMPVARLAPDLLIVNRYRPPTGGLGDAAILNLATGQYRPIGGLRRPTDRDAYPVALSVWPFARITSGPTCLNVRGKPSTDAESFGCFRDGVLLRVTGPLTTANGRDWLPVEAPGGDAHGYAAAEFLER